MSSVFPTNNYLITEESSMFWGSNCTFNNVSCHNTASSVFGVKKLPLNLLDAIRDFNKSKVIRAGFGDGLVDSYVKLKEQDWNTFNKQLSSWERETTLDC